MTSAANLTKVVFAWPPRDSADDRLAIRAQSGLLNAQWPIICIRLRW